LYSAPVFESLEETALDAGNLCIEIDGARLDTLADFQEEASERAIHGAFWGALPMDHELP
jgi:hypothetical protein